MRASSAGSTALLRSDDPQKWTGFLDRYDEAIAVVARQKSLKPAQLEEYDLWVRELFPETFSARESAHINRSDLEK
jgi:hypothetical protein